MEHKGVRKQLTNEAFFAFVEEELAARRNVKFMVRGISMMPLLWDGRDQVVVQPLGNRLPTRGDVVLFRYRGRHILHRIIAIKDGRYTMQGDGVCGTTEHAVTEDIIGVVSEVVRPSGRIVKTDSCCWRINSWLWKCLGRGRTLVLRAIVRLLKTPHNTSFRA